MGKLLRARVGESSSPEPSNVCTYSLGVKAEDTHPFLWGTAISLYRSQTVYPPRAGWGLRDEDHGVGKNLEWLTALQCASNVSAIKSSPHDTFRIAFGNV